MNVLELQHVSKSFPAFSLDDVSFSIPPGCIVGLVGENGAGKSTIIKLILNLLHRDSGHISLFGKEGERNETWIKEQIGVVFDESNFPENFRISDVNAVMQRMYSKWDAHLYDSYVQTFALPRRQMIKEFSRGMKIKLSMAVAMSHNARLLLLDEATSGLDPAAREEMLDLFWEFIQDEQHSILLSTHMISDLSKIADYIVFIHQGKVIFNQSKDELLEQYGLLHCSKNDLSNLPEDSIVGFRCHEYGAEALICRKNLPKALPLEQPSLEEIMLFFIKDSQEKKGVGV